MENPTLKNEWPENLWQQVVGHRQKQVWYKDEFEGNAPPPILFTPNLDVVLETALDERQQKIIRLRYEKGKTYREIGEQFGLGSERIRQIIKYSIRQLVKSEHYHKLKAIPESQVIQLESKIRTLTEEKAELEEQMLLLFEEQERTKAKKRLQMPLDAPVGDLGLTSRSETRLIANGIDTVGKLISCTEERIRNIERLGKASFNDIVQVLAQYGYTLKQG